MKQTEETLFYKFHGIQKTKVIKTKLKIIQKVFCKIMKPYQKIHRCFYKWNRYLLISVGHDIYNQPFQWNLISYTMHAITAMVYFCCFYTIFNYDLLFVLNAITYLCVANEVNFSQSFQFEIERTTFCFYQFYRY